MRNLAVGVSAREYRVLASLLFPLVSPLNPSYATLAVPAQSGSAAATASAGVEATGRDGSSAFTNPAALTLLDRHEFTISGGFVFPRSSFNNGSAVDALGLPVMGNSTVLDSTLVIPSAFALWVASPRLRAALAITEPFGQSVDYSNNWFGRYFGTRAELTVIDVSPVLAWRVNDSISLGGGPNFQRARVKRGTAIDFGALCQGALGSPACSAIGLPPQGADGSSSVEATSSAWGYNLGLLFELAARARVGLTYRSRIAHEFDGIADFSVPPNALPLTLGGAFTQTSARSKLTFPESAAFGGTWQATDRLALLGSVKWTRWSRFSSLTTTFGNPAQASLVEPLDWRNTLRWAGGVDYRINEQVTLHGGVAYEESPTPNATRSPLFPLSATRNLSAGLTYTVSPSVSLVGSYTNQRARPGQIDLAEPLLGAIHGTFERTLNVIGLQAIARF